MLLFPLNHDFFSILWLEFVVRISEVELTTKKKGICNKVAQPHWYWSPAKTRSYKLYILLSVGELLFWLPLICTVLCSSFHIQNGVDHSPAHHDDNQHVFHIINILLSASVNMLILPVQALILDSSWDQFDHSQLRIASTPGCLNCTLRTWADSACNILSFFGASSSGLKISPIWLSDT